MSTVMLPYRVGLATGVIEDWSLPPKMVEVDEGALAAEWGRRLPPGVELVCSSRSGRWSVTALPRMTWENSPEQAVDHLATAGKEPIVFRVRPGSSGGDMKDTELIDEGWRLGLMESWAGRDRVRKVRGKFLLDVRGTVHTAFDLSELAEKVLAQVRREANGWNDDDLSVPATLPKREAHDPVAKVKVAIEAMSVSELVEVMNHAELIYRRVRGLECP